MKVVRRLSPDSTPSNADWLRSIRWDIPAVDPNDASEIAAYFGRELAWFLTMPASRPLKPEVRRELEKIVRREGYQVGRWKQLREE